MIDFEHVLVAKPQEQKGKRGQRVYGSIDRQTMEMFQAAQQNTRAICGNNASDYTQNCRSRIDQTMQFRRVS